MAVFSRVLEYLLTRSGRFIKSSTPSTYLSMDAHQHTYKPRCKEIAINVGCDAAHHGTGVYLPSEHFTPADVSPWVELIVNEWSRGFRADDSFIQWTVSLKCANGIDAWTFKDEVRFSEKLMCDYYYSTKEGKEVRFYFQRCGRLRS